MMKAEPTGATKQADHHAIKRTRSTNGGVTGFEEGRTLSASDAWDPAKPGLVQRNVEERPYDLGADRQMHRREQSHLLSGGRKKEGGKLSFDE